MTISPLATAPGHPGGLAAGLRSMHATVDGLLAREASAVEASGCLVELERLQRRLAAVRLRLVSAASAAAVPAAEGQPTTTGWLAGATGSTRPDAAREAALATSLHGTSDGTQPGLVGTRSALEDGALSAGHARVIAEALRRLPAGLSAEQRTRCEARLVADAGRYDPDQLRRLARRVLAEIEPDPAAVDAHENALLVTEEDAAYAAARLTFHDNADGTTTGRFTLPNLQSDILRKLIDAMTAPRRSNGRDTRRRQPGDTPNPLVRDLGDPAHARGLALAQLLEHLPTDHLHGAATTQVTVLMDIETLRGHLKAAGLDTDRPISAGEARRVACNSGLVPTVFSKTLSGKPRVLDLGRTSRLFNEAQRAAITAMHTHCAARGCSRPIAWCELHHKTPWSHGGATDLANAVPLCGWHHRRIHDHRYSHEWHTDGSVSMNLRT